MAKRASKDDIFLSVQRSQTTPFSIIFSPRDKSVSASRSRNVELEIRATLVPSATRSTHCVWNWIEYLFFSLFPLPPTKANRVKVM